ncbi:MAG: cytochrome P450 [Myxococcota bacterium]|jgi:cytochrome P450
MIPLRRPRTAFPPTCTVPYPGSVQGLPEGPRAAPAVQLWQWVRDPLALLDRCRAAHGRLFTLRSPNIGHIVVTCDPAGVRQLFTAPTGALLSRPYSQVLAPMLGERSLLLLDGSDHQSLKRLMAPAFHRRALVGYAEQMALAVQRRIARWPREGTVNLKAELEAASIEIICRVVFGVSDAQRDEAAAIIQRLTHVFSPSLLYFPALRRDLGRLSPGGRLRRAREALDALLQSHIVFAPR